MLRPDHLNTTFAALADPTRRAMLARLTSGDATVLELAQRFSAFYRDCHVLGAEPETVESLRIALCVASARTIALCLNLLGVSAPEEM